MKKCCANCKYYHILKIYKRRLHQIGSNNVVSGVEIIKNKAEFENLRCCTYFYNKEKGLIKETSANEFCECWEEN